MPVWKLVVWGRKHNLSFMEFLCGARLWWCKGSLEVFSGELRGWRSTTSEMLPKVASSGLVTHGQAAALRALEGVWMGNLQLLCSSPPHTVHRQGVAAVPFLDL